MTKGEPEGPSGAGPPPGVQQLCMRNLMAVPQERLFFKDLESRFLLVSDGWLNAVGRGASLAEVIGKTDFDFFTPPHAQAAFDDEQRIIRTGEPLLAKIELETFNDRPDTWVTTSKWPLRNAAGAIIGTFGISSNVTAHMRDPATGLANRMAFMDRLRQALVALERQPGRLAVLFLDVDGFKHINDTWGHRVGDYVLAQIARRLTAVSRRFDTVARYGGDEFVILCTALRETENLSLIGDRVMRAVGTPVRSISGELRVTSSVGAVVCSNPMADPETLVEHGDIAMYAAKREGGGRFVIYNGRLHQSPGEAPGHTG